MRPSFFIALLLSIASISTTAALFWNSSAKPSNQRTAPPSSVEIKWGEGSEAGTPDAEIHK